LQALRALRHRNFQLFAAGQIISLTGTWLHNTALSWLMYRLTHSEVLLGLINVMNNTPMLLMGVLGGLAADRFSRIGILLIAQSILLGQAGVLAWLTFTGQVVPWHVYALTLLFGVVKVFEVPARQAMLPDIVERDEVVSAVSLNSMLFNLARIAGPAIAGVAVAAIGEAWCFALNATSFLAVLLALLLMRVPAQATDRAQATLRDGLDWLKANGQVSRLLLLAATVNIGFSGVTVLNPFFAEDIFHRGVAGVGWLSSAIGIGAVSGMYFLASERDSGALPRVSVVSSLLLGLALIGYALCPAFAFSLIAMALAGACLMRQNAATNSMIQLETPEHLRGQILSMFSMAVLGMSPIGSTLFAALSRSTSPRTAAFSAGAWCMGAALVLGRGIRRHGVVALLLFTLLPAYSADNELLSKVDTYLKLASEFTGFPVKRKVPAAMMSSAELERYLNRKIKTETDPKQTQIEELVLKRIGFAPADFKLVETTVDLLKEQAAAFYDFKERKLFVLDHTRDSLGPELLIHELGHALADQRYGLRKFLSGAKGDDDAALARTAVMEGQAMWLMGELAAHQAGGSLKTSPELARRLALMGDEDDTSFPVMQKVPLYLKDSLMFPYSYGFRFQAAVCEKDTNCMKRVFEQPPASSAQVMHPELYFAGTLPERIRPPQAPREGKWKSLADGVLGEIDIDILLRTYHLKEPGVVEGYRGGSYELFENKKTRDVLLTLASVWKDEAAAAKWMEAYATLLASKWKLMKIHSANPTEVSGVGDAGRFRLWRQGRQVFAEEGLPVH
jgi:MFS family permease